MSTRVWWWSARTAARPAGAEGRPVARGFHRLHRVPRHRGDDPGLRRCGAGAEATQTFGLAALEAPACGTLAVVSRTSALAEILGTDSGATADNDLDAIARAVTSVISRPERMRRNSARRRAEHHLARAAAGMLRASGGIELARQPATQRRSGDLRSNNGAACSGFLAVLALAVTGSSRGGSHRGATVLLHAVAPQVVQVSGASMVTATVSPAGCTAPSNSHLSVACLQVQGSDGPGECANGLGLVTAQVYAPYRRARYTSRPARAALDR